MLDFKVLTATFVSLAFAAVALNGAVELPEMEGFERPELPDTVGAFSQLLPAQGEDVEIKAEFVSETPNEFSLEAEKLEASNLTSLDIDQMSLESSEPVRFKEFEGSVRYANNSSIAGTAGEISTESFEISGDFDIEETGEIETVRISNSKTDPISFDIRDGEVTTESGTTEFESGTTVSMTSFEGDITVKPLEGSVKLDGKARGLVAGDLTFG